MSSQDFAAPKLQTEYPPLPYEVPAWAGSPTNEYHFEIIKNGTLLGTSKKLKSTVIFGRLPVCDIQLDHISISRYHALVQFRQDQKAFLFDLGSSHGTFLNKNRILTRHYTLLNIGDMIRLGGSSRVYVFQGPQPEPLQKSEKIDISWGFKEDAYEGDEWQGKSVPMGSIDRSIIEKHAKNSFYAQDPKKAIQVFVENNGVELSISCKQQGKNITEFTCSLEITGLQGPLTATGKGKKKSLAEQDACLEACYKLDVLGILESTNAGQSYQQRNKRLLEFIDNEDDDDYLDLTRPVKKVNDTVETLDTLSVKYTEKLKEIHELESRIEDLGKSNSDSVEPEDELDQFMNQLETKSKQDDLKKLKKRLAELKEELSQLEKLLKIVSPSYKLPVIDDLKLKEIAPIVSPVKPQTNTTDNSNTFTATGTESSTNKHSPKAKEPKRQILPSKSDMQKHMIETEPVIDLATSTQESETVSKLRQKYGY